MKRVILTFVAAVALVTLGIAAAGLVLFGIGAAFYALTILEVEAFLAMLIAFGLAVGVIALMLRVIWPFARHQWD